MADKQTTPEVQAYRLDQIEKTVSDGFAKINRKLDDISSQRPSKEEVELQIRLGLVALESEVQTLKQDKEGRDKWVNRVLGILGAVTSSLLITVIGNLLVNGAK